MKKLEDYYIVGLIDGTYAVCKCKDHEIVWIDKSPSRCVEAVLMGKVDEAKALCDIYC